jgi:hypothetical protein
MHRTYTDAQIAGGLQLISEAVLAAVFAATFVAEFTATRFPELNFVQRFGYAFLRFTLPACVFTSAIYWVIWGGFR